MTVARESRLSGSSATVSSASAEGQTFPSKARVALVIQLLLGECAELQRTKRIDNPQFWSALDAEVSRLAKLYTELETLLAQMLPFVYSNMIKAVLLLYILAFPFGVAVQLGWLTPALAFVGALIFLSIDRVGAVMESPFVDDEVHGLDLHKRIRRTDKETAALVGVWRGESAVHLNLFPETSRAALIATGKLRFHRDRRVGARGSAAPQAQRQSSRGLWAAPLLAEGER